MVYDKLLALMPPPATPLFRGSPAEWQAAEKALNFAFPEDYKWYITHYGEGLIGGLLLLFNPFSTDAACRFDFTPEGEVHAYLNILRNNRKGALAHEYPYSAYPAPGGLLPCGKSEVATVYWLLKGKPNDWQIVVEQMGPTKFTVYQESLVSFLEGVISGRVACRNFSRFAGKPPVWFEV